MCFKGRKINKLQKKVELLAKARQASEVEQKELDKEIVLHRQLATLYEAVEFNKKFPDAAAKALESYRNAAALGDIEARYILAQRLIERGKFWDSYRSSPFHCSAHDKYAKNAYGEAFVYLKSAEEAGHALAKRLHGLATINGWGIPTDTDAGFKLVIASIEQAGAWDKATQIFEELGLNKPEFFSYIMSSNQRS